MQARFGCGPTKCKLFDDDCHKVGSFVAGDGIVDVQANNDGIWIAYGDLGTTGDHGLHGWGRLSPEVWVDPVGYDGLVQFDWNGTRVGSITPPRPWLPMIDCFGLNVADDMVWACCYPGYPILRAKDDHVVGLTGLGGPVTAIAAKGSDLLLARVITGMRIRVWRARVSQRGLEEVAEVDFALDGEPISAVRRLFGRGSSLYAVTACAWYRASVA